MMPSRAAILFALTMLFIASVAVWVRSYWRYDQVTVGPVCVCSERGSVYGMGSIESLDFHVSGMAGENGRLEIETDTFYLPWLPFWTGSMRAISSSRCAGGLWWWRSPRRCCGAGGDDAGETSASLL
jgi:hypothetical protein